MSEIWNLASEIENSSFEMDRVHNLISIVLTEVFDKCCGNEKEGYYGKLLPYEQGFESVLSAALGTVNTQNKILKDVSSKLYELNRKEVK